MATSAFSEYINSRFFCRYTAILIYSCIGSHYFCTSTNKKPKKYQINACPSHIVILLKICALYTYTYIHLRERVTHTHTQARMAKKEITRQKGKDRKTHALRESIAPAKIRSVLMSTQPWKTGLPIACLFARAPNAWTSCLMAWRNTKESTLLNWSRAQTLCEARERISSLDVFRARTSIYACFILIKFHTLLC